MLLHARPRKICAWLMVGLILAAAWVRLWRFPHIPPAFNYDEAYNVVDSLWLWETGSQLVFLPGNTGRHALFHYLSIPFLLVLGVNTFAIRFLSLIICLVTIPLAYRWVKTMFAPQAHGGYLGLITAAGLAFSFWHITLSRSGFRASLLLLLYVLMAYWFWRGWQQRSTGYMIAAGVALGLCQYTYWLAGLLPLQVGLFALIWTTINRRQKRRPVWRWVGVMAVASVVVFLPLGWTYANTPLVLQYVRQSSITDRFASNPQITWSGHLLTALRIYLDGPVGLWQGQLRLNFDWPALLGFWAGIIVSIRRWRQPAYLFLLTGLLVLWLPAPLNDIDFSDLRLPDMLPVHHAISNLRLAGVLPIYYALAAVGLFSLVEWASAKLLHRRRSIQAGLAAFAITFTVSGSLNSYNFLVRWPQQPFLFERYNGPELTLAQNLLRDSYSHDILLPFYLYAHPTIQMVFYNQFNEVDAPPPLDPQRPAILVVAEDELPASYVWLTRTESNIEAAYLTPPLARDKLSRLNAQPRQTYKLAAPVFITVQTRLTAGLEPLAAALTTPWDIPNPVDYAWNNEIRLAGYQVTPRHLPPNQPIHLTLYWENLTDQPLTHDIFIHVINSRGEGVGQLDGLMLSDAHRWRKGKLSPTDYTIQPGDIPPGPYLIRLGLFNTRTGHRLPVVNSAGDVAGDQVAIGLFYVSDDSHSLDRPGVQQPATLGNQIQLLGYTLPATISRSPGPGQSVISPTLYWQANQRIQKDYTIFVQLLDSNGQFVTGFDTQPLNGNYPTSRWQPNEVIAHSVDLPLPAQLSAGDYWLVTGMYNAKTGERLPASDNKGQQFSNSAVILVKAQVTSDIINIIAPQPE